MKKEDTLISEFMGFKHNGVYFAHMAVGHKVYYHSSWDWLMPVVEKIETIGEDGGGYFLSSRGNHASYGMFFCIIVGESKIDAAYKATVEFIKWYNEQK